MGSILTIVRDLSNSVSNVLYYTEYIITYLLAALNTIPPRVTALCSEIGNINAVYIVPNVCR